MDGLGTSLDMELQSSLLQSFIDRLDEVLYVGVTTLLRLAQLVLDMIVRIVFQVLQREVLQFRLQLIETQLVSQGCIQICCLLTDLPSMLFFCLLLFAAALLHVANLAHQVHAVGNHNQDDAHVLSKRQQ